MKDFPSLKQYLSNYDLSILNKADIEGLKRNYREAYHKEYNQRRTKKRVITLRMNPMEYKSIKSLSRDYGYKSLSYFIKVVVEKYVALKLVVPHPEKRQDSINAINKIGSNINQTIRRFNREFLRSQNQSAHKSQYEHLYRLLNGYEELQREIASLRKVSYVSYEVDFEIIGMQWNEIKNNEDGKLDQLIDYLIKHRKQIDAHS